MPGAHAPVSCGQRPEPGSGMPAGAQPLAVRNIKTRSFTDPRCHLPPKRFAAGISLFELSRLMGTSIAMIDRTYGQLARHFEDAIRAPFDARSNVAGVSGAKRPLSLE